MCVCDAWFRVSVSGLIKLFSLPWVSFLKHVLLCNLVV